MKNSNNYKAFLKQASILLFVPFFTMKDVSAQEKIIRDQVWFGAGLNYQFNSRLTIIGDWSYRTNNWLKFPLTCFMRTGVTYNINNIFSVTAGGAYFINYDTEKHLPYNEWRPCEQIQAEFKINRFKIRQRYRTEQRFMNKFSGFSPDEFEYDLVYRHRYQFYVSVPLTQKDSWLKKFNLNCYDEVLFQSSDFFSYKINQNRILTGISYELTGKLRLNGSYVNIQRPVVNEKKEINHILWLQLIYSLAKK